MTDKHKVYTQVTQGEPWADPDGSKYVIGSDEVVPSIPWGSGVDAELEVPIG